MTDLIERLRNVTVAGAEAALARRGWRLAETIDGRARVFERVHAGETETLGAPARETLVDYVDALHAAFCAAAEVDGVDVETLVSEALAASGADAAGAPRHYTIEVAGWRAGVSLERAAARPTEVGAQPGERAE